MSLIRSIEEMVGNTPLLELERYGAQASLTARVYAKLESRNPAGSAKDRVAVAMIDRAEREGKLRAGGVIVEPTSGNTGIGLAAIGAARGYRVILTMPETMSLERRKLLAAYGAQIVLTPAAQGMQGALDRARELAAQTPGAVLAGQFDNPANPQIHYETTGEEIRRDLGGNPDIFVAGIGTGGTLSGAGARLKSYDPATRVVGVEPARSPLIRRGQSGAHNLQGIGANFVPKNYDAKVADEIVTVREEDAYETARLLARTEGVLVGISSGAALWAATQIARDPNNCGKRIVVVLPDTGERYLSTPLWNVEA